jgi:hypothetical protein
VSLSEHLAAEELWSARWLFTRGLGLVYGIAFVAVLDQFRPLLGEHGLLPVPAEPGRRFGPTVFRWGYSDRRLVGVAGVGLALSLAIVAGVPDLAPPSASSALWLVVWLLVWLLYLSIVNVGQRFYAFGWESLLLECGFLAAFLGGADDAPPVLVVWLLWWLVFRVEWGAGLIKWRGDACWRDLTCLRYHHETQPLPNPLSWSFHRLPDPLHKVEVAANHVTQLLVPFLLLAPQPVRGWGAAAMVVTQGWLVLSGNFAWLNLTTLLLAATALWPGLLDAVVPVGPPADLGPGPAWHEAVAVVVAAGMVALAWRPLRNMLSSQQRMNAGFNRWHLGNTYGAFGSITRVRREIVIEATEDGETWIPYELRAKPGDVRRRPRQVAPYHLRLDWLLWFAALSPQYAAGWFPALLRHLRSADPAVLRLFREDPLEGRRPTAVRATLYEYRFTTRAERKASGDWWVRQWLGPYPVR